MKTLQQVKRDIELELLHSDHYSNFVSRRRSIDDVAAYTDHVMDLVAKAYAREVAEATRSLIANQLEGQLKIVALQTNLPI